MPEFQYCHCTTPTLYRLAQKRYCRHCWLQAPPPLPVPTPHNLGVAIAWIKHSAKMGMSAERISRDLGISPVFVRHAMGDSYTP